MREMNSRGSIKAEFISIDQNIDKDMTVYLMGGGAMQGTFSQRSFHLTFPDNQKY